MQSSYSIPALLHTISTSVS